MKIPPITESSHLLTQPGITIKRKIDDIGMVECPACLGLYKSLKAYREHYRSFRVEQGGHQRQHVSVQVPPAKMVYDYVFSGYVAGFIRKLKKMFATFI